MMKVQRKINSAVGVIYLVASEKYLHGIFWKDQKIQKEEAASSAHSSASKILDKTECQIGEYLAGKRQEFNIPIQMDGTAFQKRVWARLAQIPYGETRSYKDIAKELKDANASRAVGTANGRNPISLIVPCHRVISSDGTMGGYAGGLSIKEMLLNLEKTNMKKTGKLK
ncbi:methylated-DNA--[protein]-cysteine S-methyltransferase [Pseudobdellovibrio exovorus]|uniref:Methylated-DNA--protein-cysteine methyltransferase n=1 Tax=Pseudobdellovibrio exovorus JSS TaxID=1184267 RepID=M4VN89_9BACT|nr:methylated-DNA--[protein]-cysteine S-methyltransferase [Pseudobdellovibrio exovorus]AGH94544.1 hypothetical protein A11Q_324 [Pseudobdellovibrio exovorus JSS]